MTAPRSVQLDMQGTICEIVIHAPQELSSLKPAQATVKAALITQRALKEAGYVCVSRDIRGSQAQVGQDASYAVQEITRRRLVPSFVLSASRENFQ